MDNLSSIDIAALRAGRDTDRLVAEFVYCQQVKTDPDGELRVSGECGHDPTPGEVDVRELAIVPQYSRDAMLAEEAFVHVLGRNNQNKLMFNCCEPGGIYGDSAWTLRDQSGKKKVASAPTKALMYCKAALLTLQTQTASEEAATPASA